MKQIVVLSGKGGAGKTSITSMLAYEIIRDYEINNPVFIDADVDASNLELIFSPTIQEKTQFSGGKIAVFDQTKCIGCQRCIQACRFDALSLGTEGNKDIRIDEYSCEGCGLCTLVCPRNALSMEQSINGEWYHSESRFGPLYHANLYPGAENSGKLVTKVRQAAIDSGEEIESDLLLIDGPPGIGCPVLAAVTGTDFAILVTEPSLSGLHDLERIYQTVNHFDIPSVVIINKSGLNDEINQKIFTFCRERNLKIIGEIPFAPEMVNAIVDGKTIQEGSPKHNISHTFQQVWLQVKSSIINNA